MIELTKQECRKDLTDTECAMILEKPVVALSVMYGSSAVRKVLVFLSESNTWWDVAHSDSHTVASSPQLVQDCTSWFKTDGEQSSYMVLGHLLQGLSRLTQQSTAIRAVRWIIENSEEIVSKEIQRTHPQSN